MRHHRLRLWTASVVAASLLGGSSAVAGVVVPPPPTVAVRTTPPQFIWPAYKYPDLASARSQWLRAIATGGGQTFIVNPANGPGKAANDDYREVIARARAAGIRLLGYVDTDYATRPLATVKTEIARWRTFYGIRDVFFDQAESHVGPGGSLIDYYRSLHAYVHAGGGTVMLNPGVVPDPTYVEAADAIVTFEGSAASYGDASFPRWTADLPDRAIAHLVYATTAAEQAAIVQRAHQLGAGSIFVTDDALSNPYDSLPSYYELERSQLRAMG